MSGLMILTMAGLAGCGGGGDDSGDGDRLTRAEFLKQANAICKKGDARIDKEAENIDDEADTEEVAAFIEDTVLPETRAQVDDVDDLKPPENLADDVDEALAATRRALDKVEDDPEGAIEDGEEIFADANERLNDLGLTECGDDNESDDEGSDDEGLTESEFTTQGNALCQEFQD
ncbi:MAG: hypothetical protein ACRDY5_06720, partial [Acidimicrobiales bacterium]